MKLLGSLLVGVAYAQSVTPPTTVTPGYPPPIGELEQCCIKVISNIPDTDEKFVETWTIKVGIYFA